MTHLAAVPDLDFDDPGDLRIVLDTCRSTLIDSAGELAEAVKTRTDDPLLFALADMVVNSLRLERRIRRLLAAEVSG